MYKIIKNVKENMRKTKTQEVNSIPVDQLMLSTLQQILGMLQKFEGILLQQQSYNPTPVLRPAEPVPTPTLESLYPQTTCGTISAEPRTTAPAEILGTPGTVTSGWDLVNKEHPTAHIQPASEKPVGARKARAPKASKQEVENPVGTAPEVSPSLPSSSVHVPSTVGLQPAADDFGLGL